MQEMIAWVQLAIGRTSVHIGQFLFHRRAREHGDILEAEGREYIALEVLIQGLIGCAFDANTGPIYANLSRTLARSNQDGGEGYSILPAFSWLVDKRLKQISKVPRELIVPDRLTVVAKTLVEERITEASWTPLSRHGSQACMGFTYLCG